VSGFERTGKEGEGSGFACLIIVTIEFKKVELPNAILLNGLFIQE
jgi:hypothetical protein